MGWMVSFTPRPPFTPGERAHGTHCTGVWVGPRAGLDAEARGKILCPSRGSKPGVWHCTEWAAPAHLQSLKNCEKYKLCCALHFIRWLHTSDRELCRLVPYATAVLVFWIPPVWSFFQIIRLRAHDCNSTDFFYSFGSWRKFSFPEGISLLLWSSLWRSVMRCGW
jgi:hypothetical protein